MRTHVFAWILPLVLIGCVSHQVPSIQNDPEVIHVKQRFPTPHRFRIGVSPPKISFDPDLNNRRKNDSMTWSISPSTNALQKQVVGFLRQNSLFREVKQVPAFSNRNDAFHHAWTEGLDLLVTLDVEDHDVFYEGVNGWYLPNVFNWILNSLVLSWFVPDEDYGIRSTYRATIHTTDSEAQVWSKQHSYKTQRSLTDFDRGWIPMGIFRIPDSLTQENWKAVHGILEPFWAGNVEKNLLLDLAGFREQLEEGKFVDEFNKTLALVIGVSRYQAERVTDIPEAKMDAETVATFLKSPSGGAVSEKSMRVLTDIEATRTAILDEIQSLFAKRSNKRDTCILYFSGYGYSDASGSPALVPYDFDPSNPNEDLLPLEELSTLLSNVSARDIFVLLDTSFGGESGAKTLRLRESDGKASSASLVQAFKLFTKEGRTVLLASRANQAAKSHPGAGMGIFTYYLMEAARGKGYQGDRLPPTFKGAFDHARKMVPHWAMISGDDQTPVRLGTPHSSFRIRRKKMKPGNAQAKSNKGSPK